MEDSNSATYVWLALKWFGAFVTGVIGMRQYHAARIKTDSQEWNELKFRVATQERRQREFESLTAMVAASVEDHEARIVALQKRAERDHQEVTRQLSRMDDKLDRLLDAEDR